jgi:ankyrin repeat protein
MSGTDLQQGRPVNKAGTDECTVLMAASAKGNLVVVRALISSNANVSKACTDGRTALALAIHFGFAKVAEVLKSAVANAR